MVKDYYGILQVPPGSSNDDVREAFRRLAKTQHPDRAGLANTPRFRNILEAYEVLSDPRRRTHYDRQRAEDSPPPLSSRSADEPLVDVGRPPFVDVADALRDREPSARPGGWRPDIFGRLDVEVILRSSEAHTGVVAPVTVLGRCVRCQGRGHRGGRICGTCGGDGLVPRTAHIAIPAGVSDGAVIVAQVAELRTQVRLYIRIREH